MTREEDSTNGSEIRPYRVSLLKPPEPGIRENVTRAICRPARRIHFTVRFYDRIVIIDLAAALP